MNTHLYYAMPQRPAPRSPRLPPLPSSLGLLNPQSCCPPASSHPSHLPLLIPSPPSSPHNLSHIPKLLFTPSLTVFSNSPLLSLHILAASIFAGLSSFGSASMLITLINIFSTLCIGLHLSDAFS